jgi:hypothetical protein
LELSSARAWLPLLIVGLLVTAPAERGVAQDEYEQTPDLNTLEDVPDRAPSQGIPVDIRVRSDTRFIVGSDFGSSDANLYWPRGSMQVGVPLSKRAAVRFRLNGGAAIYDFDRTINLFGRDPDSAPPGNLFDPDPFDNLYAGSFAVEGVYRMSDTWGLFTHGFVTARWEDGASFDDSISGGGGLAVGYKIRDRLDLILGVGLKSRLDRSGPRPYPLVDLEWRIDDSWTLHSHGKGLAVEYAVNNAFKIFLRGRIESRRYRLDNRLGLASRGTVRDRQIPVGLGFRWVANRNIRIGVVAGVMAYHQLKVRDRNRDTIESISADPAPYFELRIDFRP